MLSFSMRMTQNLPLCERQSAESITKPSNSKEHVSVCLWSSVSFHNLILGTGEHGVGTGKRNYLLTELGEGTVALMRTIKQTLDPHNLFNPGKVRSSSVNWMFDTIVSYSCILISCRRPTRIR